MSIDEQSRSGLESGISVPIVSMRISRLPCYYRRHSL